MSHSCPDPGSVPSEGEQQEAGEDAEVSGVVVESVARRQTEANDVSLVQLQSDAIGR